MLDTHHTLGDLETLLDRRQAAHALELVHWLSDPGALGADIAVAPDAVAIIRTTAGSIALVLDVDTGTLSMKRMRQRFEAYARWWERGGVADRFDVSMVRVLVVTTHTHRLARLRDAARDVSPASARHLFWFATCDAFEDHHHRAAVVAE